MTKKDALHLRVSLGWALPRSVHDFLLIGCAAMATAAGTLSRAAASWLHRLPGNSIPLVPYRSTCRSAFFHKAKLSNSASASSSHMADIWKKQGWVTMAMQNVGMEKGASPAGRHGELPGRRALMGIADRLHKRLLVGV